ncbi:hypothetical protein EYF80_002310 [Liparis tanakae]|uniref:Uncharacterized protein n=1 Tax=Liparis tanakae TaxID=230148 RepID=A0A4Z2JCT7_9TELE|nr:hypothetical protein EYF80_002310 [Liparis tanakae]
MSEGGKVQGLRAVGPETVVLSWCSGRERPGPAPETLSGTAFPVDLVLQPKNWDCGTWVVTEPLPDLSCPRPSLGSRRNCCDPCWSSDSAGTEKELYFHRVKHTKTDLLHKIGEEGICSVSTDPSGRGMLTRNTSRARVLFFFDPATPIRASTSALRSFKIPTQSTLHREDTPSCDRTKCGPLALSASNMSMLASPRPADLGPGLCRGVRFRDFRGTSVLSLYETELMRLKLESESSIQMLLLCSESRDVSSWQDIWLLSNKSCGGGEMFSTVRRFDGVI